MFSMRKKTLTFGFSPCPNDTYMFYALAHSRVDDSHFDFAVDLQDVETLNKRANDAYYDLTKVSIHAVAHLSRHYVLLNSGGAMGMGCGPLVVSSRNLSPSDLTCTLTAIPGKFTTANLLYQLFTGGNSRVLPMTYDTIMEKVTSGEVPAGVIIHEGRFTYHLHGLRKVVDLGEWWEKEYGLPLPLGGILMKKSFGRDAHKRVESLIRQSIRYARSHEKKVWKYVKKNAQEMSDDVIKKHIELYVNDYSEDFGPTGRKAIVTLLEVGAEAGILPKVPGPIFQDD